jgi:hypothetical protein
MCYRFYRSGTLTDSLFFPSRQYIVVLGIAVLTNTYAPTTHPTRPIGINVQRTAKLERYQLGNQTLISVLIARL